MLAPVVSVLLPARNAAATVERALRSVLSQVGVALEVVAVDDASTDGTGEVLHRLSREDARVRVLSGPGQGLVAALRTGLAACLAPFIARMDADDESHPERLMRSLAALEANPSWAVVGTQVELVRADRPPSPNMQAYARWLNSLTTPEAVFRDRFVESPLCHPATTLRRGPLEAVGAWEEGDFPEDYQLWLKLIAAGHLLTNVALPLFRWSDGEDRLTRTDPRYAPEKFLALKAKFLARGPLEAERRCRVWGAGQTGLALTRALRLEGVDVVELLEVDPKKVGSRINGIPVSSYSALDKPAEHLVAAVGAKGARAEIRGHLTGLGWRESEHFTCAA